MADRRIATARRGRLLALFLLAAAGGACRQRAPQTAAAPRAESGADSTARGRAADRDTDRSARVATDRDWEGRSVGRVEELFAGRFAGVKVYEMPGGIAVRVRGGTSLTGSNEPLYVVDGMPYVPGDDGLLALNPSDIARIEVLKDAAQLAEYGSRGANGVVLIRTKRGR